MTQGAADPRAALRARQGAGARYDAPEAPAADLLRARRATAAFARVLNEADDDAFAAPSAGGVSALTLATVTLGYEARHIALQLECLIAPDAGYAHIELPTQAVALTLPARALRHLFSHSAIHLDTCWRDLQGPLWEANIAGSAGEAVKARFTPRARTDNLCSQLSSIRKMCLREESQVQFRYE
ncbi:hypothetical protein [Yoonia sp. R2-816]|uniref:hypothetical protein n=1 Tax=Yoonia sp. R2-816 TaxID=3342638 RepID=UPI00372A7DC4